MTAIRTDPASIGMAMFGQHAGNITREAKYYDGGARPVQHGAGRHCPGRKLFYVNPLEVAG